MILRLAGYLALLTVLVAGSAAVPGPSGPGWQEGHPHAPLVDALASAHTVRVIESTLDILPVDQGGTLFLFPDHRVYSASERSAIADFVASGGTLVVATDHSQGAQVVQAVGGSLVPVAAFAVDPDAGECVNATIPRTPERHICLPSPAVLAESRPGGGTDATWLALSEDKLAMDLDLDGNLSLPDRGPFHAPVARAWDHGGGHVVLIADSEVWIDATLDGRSENRLFALDLVAPDATVYLDGTGGSATPVGHMSRPLVAAVAHPAVVQALALGALAAATVATIAMLRPAAAWRRHEADTDAVDPDVEEQAMKILLNPQSPLREDPREDNP